MRKLIELDGAERRALTASTALIPLVKLLLKFAGLSRTQSLLPRLGSRVPGRRLHELIDKLEARRWAPRLTCLERSLVMWSVLGEPAVIRFGVRLSEGQETPQFHAWIDVDGVSIGADDHVGYREFMPAAGPGVIREKPKATRKRS